MAPFHIAVQTRALRLPLKKALATAAELGAEGVEIDGRNELRPHEMSRTAVRQFRKSLEDLGLRVAAIAFPTRGAYCEPDGLERRITATKQAMELAYALGARYVVNQVGRVPDSGDGPEWNMLLEVLGDLARFGDKAGAALLAETGSESGPALARLIDAIPSASLGVAFNPGNLIVNGFSPSEAIDALGAHVRYVKAKDGVRDLARGRSVEVTLGRGMADFPNLLGQLAERGYRGFVTIEREHADNPLAEIGQAVQYLKALQRGD